MAQVKYQVQLSSGGGYSVTATGDDAAAVKTALSWVRSTYAEIGKEQKAKTEQLQLNKAEDRPAIVPECVVHKVPMTRQEGKYGPFWSCRKRNPDGTFCKYRPKDR